MKKILPVMFFLSVVIFAQSVPISTVNSVDLERYSGKWYEISKIPNSFQDHCEKNTTANYEIDDEGDIIVTNACVDFQDELVESEGLAKIVDNETNSKLEVSFVSILGWNVFWGDYWILGLDENYRFAVIGTPSRKYGWILSRTPQMAEDDLEECYQILENNGYKRNKFELSVQEY